MNKVVDELDSMLSNLSIDQLDDVITRMEKMKVSQNRDQDVEGLIMSMGSLTTLPNHQKLDAALEGVKKHKKRVFARKYKSVSGRKTKLSSNQIDDIFATMEALKDDEESIELDDILADMGQLDDDDVSMGGAKKRRVKKGGKKPTKKPVKKGGKKPVKKRGKK